MTIPELINMTLDRIRNYFYRDRVREFKRDETALIKAISTYGYVCHHRGWDFETDFIFKDIIGVLNTIRDAQLEIKYLPVYLEGAMRRHVGQRAEELQAASRARGEVKAVTSKLVENIGGVERVTAVIKPTNTETLAAVHLELKRLRKARKRTPKACLKNQEALL